MFNKVSVKVIFSVVIPIVLLFSCTGKEEDNAGFTYTICNQVFSGPVKPFERTCSIELVTDSYIFQSEDFSDKFQGYNENKIHLYQTKYYLKLDSVCQLEKFRFNAIIKVNKSYDLNKFTVDGWMSTSETGKFDDEDVFHAASGEDHELLIDTTSSLDYNYLQFGLYRSCEDGRYPFIHPDSIFSVSVKASLYFKLTYENNVNLSIQEFYDNVQTVDATLQAPLAE